MAGPLSKVDKAMAACQERPQRGHHIPFLRETGCLGHDPGNALPFPVHDLSLLCASVSPPQVVARNWDMG